MKLAEAQRRARSNLYRYKENSELLEHYETVGDMIREHGSRVEQQYGNKPGEVSRRYVEAVPSWFLALDNAEWVYSELLDAVSTVSHLLKYLQERELKLFELYARKYRDKIPLPDLRRRFDRKLKMLDQDLIFMLIDWHTWPIDRDGGEEYAQWRRKRGY